MKSSLPMYGLFLVLGAVLGGAGYHAYSGPQQDPRAKVRPEPNKPRDVACLGRVEPVGGLISVGPPFPDRIESLEKNCKEGVFVKEGEPLLTLASRADRQREYDLVTAQIDEANDQIQSIQLQGELRISLEKLKRKQIDELEPIQISLQKAKISLYEKQADQARKNQKRLAELGDSVVSKQEREQQDLLLRQAEAELVGANEGMTQLVLGKKLERESIDANLKAASEEIKQKQMQVPLKTLVQKKAIAKAKLDETVLRAPSDGEILKVYFGKGELVSGQHQVLVMADTRKMGVIAEVYETDVGRIHVGQKVSVKGRAWPNETLSGTVTGISTIIAKNRVFDADPTSTVDRRVVEARILLEKAEPASKLIHHQVTVFFLDK